MSEDLKELIADVREQVKYLRELGVDELGVELSETMVRSADAASERPGAERLPETVTPLFSKPPSQPSSEPSKESVRPGSRLASLPSLKSRSPGNTTEIEKIEPDAYSEPVRSVALPNDHVPDETIETIRAEIGRDCTRCKLCGLGRSQVVNSVGNFNADLMFVGEAPGADEDLKGEPFVGRAGQLLTDIIEKGLQIKREDVFIGNINRCRPPGNRAPEPDETIACKPFLVREIAVVRPRVIVVLGATAAHNLLETKVPISKLRGQFHDHLGVKVMPTFHPAYLLRDPHKKREVWEDMKLVRDYLKT